jgi:hypothetical protein
VWTEGGAGGGERRLVLHHAVHGEFDARGDVGAGLPHERVRGASGGPQRVPDLHRQPGWLYPPVRSSPSPPCSVCEPVTRSPSLIGWAGGRMGGLGTQGPAHGGAYGHHAHGAGVVYEPDEPVRLLSPSPACRVERWWLLTSGVGGCRGLDYNHLTGTMPTELGLLRSLIYLCVPPHPPPCVSR